MPKFIETKKRSRSYSAKEQEKIRDAGYVLANIYGKDLDSEAIFLNRDDIRGVFEGKKYCTYLQGKNVFLIAKDIHWDPKQQCIHHISFQAATEGQRIRAMIPVKVRRKNNVASTRNFQKFSQLMRSTIEVEGRIDKLPDFITIDEARLARLGRISLETIKLPEQVEPAADNKDITVAMLKDRSAAAAAINDNSEDGDHEVEVAGIPKTQDEKPADGTTSAA